MGKLSAWIQIIFICALVSYSTFCLFIGRFEQAFAPFPILALYWVFVASRASKNESRTKSDKKES